MTTQPDTTTLKPCPFDGTLPEFDHYGTFYSLTCPVCACGPDIQISDLMTMDERMAMTFDINAQNYGYPKDVVLRVAEELVTRWNTRYTPKEPPHE